MHEGKSQGPDQGLFCLSELVRVPPVYGWEVCIVKLIGLFPDGDFALVVIDLVQKEPGFKAVLGVLFDELAFEFELDNADGLAHLGGELRIYRIVLVLVKDVSLEALTRVIAVDFRREHGEGAKVDAVPVFKRIEGVVAGSYSEHVGDAGRISAGSAHPVNVVVAPLDVNVVEVHELFHNKIRPCTSVKDISDDVKGVDGQVLDQLAERNNELVRKINLDDTVYDLTVIELLVEVVHVKVKELVDGVGVVGRHLLADLGPCVLGADDTANRDKPVYGYLLMLLEVLLCIGLVMSYFINYFSGIID